MFGLKKILLGIFLVALFQCTPDHQMDIDPEVQREFATFIQAFTSGELSNQSHIFIELADPIIGVKAGDIPAKSPFKFEPGIAGTARWKTNQIIEFLPSESLKSGQSYTAGFNLNAVIDTLSDYPTFPFSFRIRNQYLSMEMEGAKALDTKNLVPMEVNGIIHSSDYADPEQIEKSLQAMQEGEELTIRWQHFPDDMKYLFTLTGIDRKEKISRVEVSMDASSIGMEGKSEQTIELAALGDFRVMEIKTLTGESHEIQVYFSDPLDENQSMDGLVRLGDDQSIDVEIQENILLLHPTMNNSGSIELRLEPGIRNAMGYVLPNQYKQYIVFEDKKPAIEWISDATIYPGSGLKLPFRAVNLSGVQVKVLQIYTTNIPYFLQENSISGSSSAKRYGRLVYSGEIDLQTEKAINRSQWNTFSLDLERYFQSEPGALYRVQLSFGKHQSLYPCEESGSSENMQSSVASPDVDESFYDGPNSDYYYYSNDFYINYDYSYDYYERDNPCNRAYYLNNKNSITRNILSSDIGIIAKAGDNHNYRISVQSIQRGLPLSGVSIKALNFQLQTLGKSTTGNDGVAQLNLPGKPFLLIAEKNNQKSYLKVDNGNALSMSMFDVGGRINTKGLKGFIYGERGVWRPGDTLFLSFMLEDQLNVLPKEHPVVMELYTPMGKLHAKAVRNEGLNGVYSFKMITDSEDPSGKWKALVRVGGTTFTKYCKVENIKPNRLKIDLNFRTEELHASDPSPGTIHAEWLHGAKASNLRTVSELTFKKGHTTFEDFSKYTFDLPNQTFYEESNIIVDDELDAEGNISFSLNVPDYSNAPGKLIARFSTRVFERGGEASIDMKDYWYSPYTSYAGVFVPEGEGWNGALYGDETNLIEIATVDEYGKPVNRKEVKIEVYEVYWRYWWDRNHSEDISQYLSNKHRFLLKSDYVDTKNGKATYALKLDDFSWGRKLIVITDPVSGHRSGKMFYMDYKYYAYDEKSQKPGGAEMLNFSLDKKKYEVGDPIKLLLPKAKAGRVWISIENGSEILDSFWKDIEEGTGEIELKAQPEMAPNAYVHLSFIQPHRQTLNDLPIRMYGVQPLFVHDPATRLNPELTLPDRLRPEEPYSIGVSEKDGKPMTYTLAIVDEGLLDLTRFKTPRIWNHFYTREALGIRTWDLYSDVIGAFSGEMAGLLEIGGDEDLESVEQKKLNRFKPVVTFLGPFELGAGENKIHNVSMPNYVGSVRAMIVARDNHAYGSAEQTRKVKKPVMVLATLPRTLSPGEEVKLPVTVFSMEDKPQKIKVKVETEGLLNLTGEANQSVEFEESGDKMVYFNLKVPEKIGQAKVHIIASAGNEKATYDIELAIRIPNPPIHTTKDVLLEKSQTQQISFEPIGMNPTNRQVLEVALIPPLNLENRLNYLIRYPHGCLEQTVSSVFPQLFLENLVELTPKQKNDVQYFVDQAIQKIRRYQLNDGGFSYWPSYSFGVNEWATNYAGHFLYMAKEKGYYVPDDILSSWIRYQRKSAASWDASNKSSYQFALQSYRLFTLALAGQPMLSSMNRLRENPKTKDHPNWYLAAAYQLSGQPEIAKMVLASVKPGMNEQQQNEYYRYTYGNEQRDRALQLYVYALTGELTKGKTLLDQISRELGSATYFNTHALSYSLIAISSFIGEEEVSGNGEFMLTVDGKDAHNVNFSKPVHQSYFQFQEGVHSVTLENRSDRMLFVRFYSEGVPLKGDEKSDQNNLKFTVDYMDMDGNSIQPTSIVQGTDFLARVSIESTNYYSVNDMALTQLFPSGWEIRNQRIEGMAVDNLGDKPDYQDIRDDRVLTYFNLIRSNKKQFVVLLNASYRGRFYLPSVFCEAMYDNTIYGKTGGRWVEVIAP